MKRIINRFLSVRLAVAFTCAACLGAVGCAAETSNPQDLSESSVIGSSRALGDGNGLDGPNGEVREALVSSPGAPHLNPEVVATSPTGGPSPEPWAGEGSGPSPEPWHPSPDPDPTRSK